MKIRLQSMLPIWLVTLGMVFLSACGTLVIQVESNPSPSSGNQASHFPTQTASFTLISPSKTTPTNPPESTLAPEETTVVPFTLNQQTGRLLSAGTPLKISRIKMMDTENGWAIGQVEADLLAHILLTSDGGRTWKDRTPLEALNNLPPDGLNALAFFASVQTAWVTFTSRNMQSDQNALVVWRTADGGQTWSKGAPFDLAGVQVEFQLPSDLGFVDSQHGWIELHIGAGMMHDYIAVFTTEDGGKSWNRVLDPNSGQGLMACEKSGLVFSTSLTGWITGNCPGLMPNLYFYRSDDGGVNWNLITLPEPQGMPSGFFGNESENACGIPQIDFSTVRSMILTVTCTDLTLNKNSSWWYASFDGGLSWTNQPLPIAYNTRMSLVRSDEGFLVGSNQLDPNEGSAVYHSANGSSSWTLTTLTQWTGQPDFIDSLNGWVIAVHNEVSALVRTQDGGKTWVELKPVVG